MSEYRYKAEIIRCVDGDTVDAWIDVGFDMRIKQRLRLHGIDTPETRTRNLTEKKVGMMAKARVQELLEVGRDIPDLDRGERQVRQVSRQDLPRRQKTTLRQRHADKRGPRGPVHRTKQVGHPQIKVGNVR